MLYDKYYACSERKCILIVFFYLPFNFFWAAPAPQPWFNVYRCVYMRFCHLLRGSQGRIQGKGGRVTRTQYNAIISLLITKLVGILKATKQTLSNYRYTGWQSVFDGISGRFLDTGKKLSRFPDTEKKLSGFPDELKNVVRISGPSKSWSEISNHKKSGSIYHIIKKMVWNSIVSFLFNLIILEQYNTI